MKILFQRIAIVSVFCGGLFYGYDNTAFAQSKSQRSAKERRAKRARWRKKRAQRLAKKRAKRARYRRWFRRYYDPFLRKCGKPCIGRLNKMHWRKINRALAHLQKTMKYHERLRILSAMFLGTRYRYGPLGEGRRGRYDRDPIFRLNRVDCVTYVETVMALALSKNLAEAKRRLQLIRYKDGRISYAYRNHFTATQWLVENHKAGYIREISKEVGGRRYTKILTKKVTPKTWRWTFWKKRIPKHMLPKSFRFAYIRLEDLGKVLHRLPNIGWIGEVADVKDSAVAVQHVGFFVRKRGKVYFRDANVKPGVSDHTLLGHARWRLRQRKEPNRRYYIIGFAFAAFTNPPKKTPSSLQR